MPSTFCDQNDCPLFGLRTLQNSTGGMTIWARFTETCSKAEEVEVLVQWQDLHLIACTSTFEAELAWFVQTRKGLKTKAALRSEEDE
eukprot:3950244-Amphidinium_carterae.1